MIIVKHYLIQTSFIDIITTLQSEIVKCVQKFAVCMMLSLLILAPIALVSHNIKPGSTVTSHPSVKDKLVEGKFLRALITPTFVTVVI